MTAMRDSPKVSVTEPGPDDDLIPMALALAQRSNMTIREAIDAVTQAAGYVPAARLAAAVEVVTKTEATSKSLEAELIQTRRGRANASYQVALMKSKLDRIKMITNPISIHPDMPVLNLIAKVNDILSEQ